MPKRAKKKKEYAICPCCKTPRDRTEMATVLKIQEGVERKLYKNYSELGIHTYSHFVHNDFEWACDDCLKNRDTVLANPLGQLGAWTHHIAYHDTPLVCATCSSDFVFSAQEKKRWYEQYQIWNFIQPQNCPSCRKDIREFKNKNTRLSNLLESGTEDLSVDEIREIIAIYHHWNKPDRVKFYEALLRKAEKVEKLNDGEAT